MTDRTLTLGPAIASSAISFVGGGRFRGQASAQAEYGKFFTGTVTPNAGGALVLTAMRTYTLTP